MHYIVHAGVLYASAEMSKKWLLFIRAREAGSGN